MALVSPPLPSHALLAVTMRADKKCGDDEDGDVNDDEADNDDGGGYSMLAIVDERKLPADGDAAPRANAVHFNADAQRREGGDGGGERQLARADDTLLTVSPPPSPPSPPPPPLALRKQPSLRRSLSDSALDSLVLAENIDDADDHAISRPPTLAAIKLQPSTPRYSKRSRGYRGAYPVCVLFTQLDNRNAHICRTNIRGLNNGDRVLRPHRIGAHFAATRLATTTRFASSSDSCDAAARSFNTSRRAQTSPAFQRDRFDTLAPTSVRRSRNSTISKT